MSIERLITEHNDEQRKAIESEAASADLTTEQLPVYKRKRTLMRKAFAELIRGRDIVADWDQPSTQPKQRRLKFEPVALGKKLIVFEGIDTTEGKLRPVYVQPGLCAGPNYDPDTLEDAMDFSLYTYAKLTLPRDAKAARTLGGGIATIAEQVIIYTGGSVSQGYDIQNPRLKDMQEIDSFMASIQEILSSEKAS